jgi:hypothetical protein
MLGSGWAGLDSVGLVGVDCGGGAAGATGSPGIALPLDRCWLGGDTFQDDFLVQQRRHLQHYLVLFLDS